MQFVSFPIITVKASCSKAGRPSADTVGCICIIMGVTLIQMERTDMYMDRFKAVVVDKVDGKVEKEVKDVGLDDLAEGEVTMKVAYSSVNYQDGMVAV